jgi:hypothetical protein
MPSRPSATKIAEQNRCMLKRQHDFRHAADAVVRALCEFPEIVRIALFGSVARPLVREVPRFSEFARDGIEVYHECKDVDLAVWIDATYRLKEIGRARGLGLNQLLEAHNIGVAHHQIDMFFLSPTDGHYLGRLCWYGTCPKGKPECRVPGCGASAFLKQHANFVLAPDATLPPKAVTLFERGTGIVAKAGELEMQG